MSTRYSIVTLAYPREYRHTHAAELVQTANELASDRWSPQQSRSLLVEGLRTRARLSSNGSTAQIWGNGIAIALGLTFLLWTAFPLADLLDTRVTILWLYSPWIYLTQGLATLTALTVSTRWPTAAIITAANAASVIGVLQSDPTTMRQSTLPYALATSALAWWLATRTDGRRAFSPTTALLLLGVVVGISTLPGSLGTGVAVAVIQFGAVLLGLVLVTIDPRPLIVATTFYTLTTITTVFSLQSFKSEGGGIVVAVSIAALAAATLLSRFGTRRLLAT